MKFEKENQSKSIDSLAQDPYRCQHLPSTLHPFHKICNNNNNNNILESGMGGLLLKLLKITCCDCILQPLSAQSEDTSSSSCLSWWPWVPSDPSPAELLTSKGQGTWGNFPTKLTGCQPRQAEAELSHRYWATSMKPSAGGAAGGKKESTRIIKILSTGIPLADMPHNLHWPCSFVKLQPPLFLG